MSYQSPKKFEEAETVQELLETYGDHMYCLGKSFQAGHSHPVGTGDEIAEQFWSRLRELLPVGDETRNYIDRHEVFEGMRIRMFRDEDARNIKGATGTIVVPDHDWAPGVHFDDPWSHLNDLDGALCDAGLPFTYISLKCAERIDDDK